MKEGVRAVKACCQALKSELAGKWRPKYNRSHIAFLASVDGESLIANWVAEIEEKTEGLADGKVGAFGDGSILDRWLEFLGGDGFQSFLDALLPFLEAIFSIVIKLI
jgi:hypothetical protein